MPPSTFAATQLNYRGVKDFFKPYRTVLAPCWESDR